MSETYERLPKAHRVVFQQLMAHLQNTRETSLYGVDFTPLTPEQAEMVLALLYDNRRKYGSPALDHEP